MPRIYSRRTQLLLASLFLSISLLACGGGSGGSDQGPIVCAAQGATCGGATACCTGLSCSAAGTCEASSSCSAQGAACDASNPCCNGLSCFRRRLRDDRHPVPRRPAGVHGRGDPLLRGPLRGERLHPGLHHLRRRRRDLHGRADQLLLGHLRRADRGRPDRLHHQRVLQASRRRLRRLGRLLHAQLRGGDLPRRGVPADRRRLREPGGLLLGHRHLRRVAVRLVLGRPPGGTGATCRTLGEACADPYDCCSTNCQGGACVPAYSCSAYGDICYEGDDCCSGLCDTTGGTPGRCVDPSGGCVQGGNPCTGPTNCCSRLCASIRAAA